MPSPYRYTTPVRKQAATGPVAAVYAQIGADFILADGPLMSLSPTPDLLAATWSLLREAQVTGRAPRVNKEAVATAVSFANRCPFCVDAHAALVHAAGAHELAEAVWRGTAPPDPAQAALVDWARATATPGVARVPPPFPDELAAEYVATALVTHFLNRMTSSLVNENLLPGRLRESSLVRRVAGRALGRSMRRAPTPGLSLPLLDGLPREVEPAWAAGSPIGAAYGTLLAVAAGGGALLGPRGNALVLEAVTAWDGTAPLPRALDDRLAMLPAGERAAARLALLAALDPHRIADADVAALRILDPTDAGLIRTLAFGAMAAVGRIAAWIGAASFAGSNLSTASA